METEFESYGVLSKSSNVDDLKSIRYKENIYLLNNKSYLYTKSGEYYTFTATLLASKQNSCEVEYDGNETVSIPIGLPITINK